MHDIFDRMFLSRRCGPAILETGAGHFGMPEA
jgi:hypothetical protein